MAARQYTKCVQPADYTDLGISLNGAVGILLLLMVNGSFAFILAIALGGPPALALAIAGMVGVVAYLHWWLNVRLICLNEEPCLIGMVRRPGASNPLEKAGDDDFTMNLLLAPGPTAFREDFRNAHDLEPPVSDYQSALQGRLVSPQQSIFAIGRGYVTDEGHSNYVTGLHCEFEGSGIYNLLIAAGIVLALLIALLVVQLIPGFGWLATLLFWLALLVGGFALLTGPLSGLAGAGAAGAGDPTNLGGHLKELAQGDIVIVKGEWIYDSLHDGWNEIHPVRACCILAKAPKSLTWPGAAWPPGFATAAEVGERLKRCCPMLDDARKCEEGGNRDDPANGWILHPLVDGCSNVIIT